MFVYVVILFIFLNIICDINYLTRTLVAVLTGRLYQRRYSLDETTTIYGICTFQDCDISFRHIRLARLLRDLDFARYHFYERTGIYRKSGDLGIKSLQGCTLTITDVPVPLFGLYKINTKLVYWDDRSLFLEHEVITLHDAALYSWYEEWRVLDFSAAGVRTAITCIAPAPRLLSSLEMPLMPFSWYMWLAVAFTYFYASIGMITVLGYATNSYPFLHSFGMMLGQSQYENTSSLSWKMRSITGWLLIAGLILSSAYGAGLASTFTVPKFEPSIDTVQDIVDRGLEWGATHDAWIFSLTLSSEPLVKQLVSQFRIYSFAKLKEKSFTRTMAYSIEKLPAGNFAIGEYVTQEAVLDMMLMVEDFYYEQCVVMMRKSSPYTEKVSQLVGRLHQTGLLLAWETQVALKHLNYKVQVEVRLSRTEKDVATLKPLNLDNVVGVFIVYAIGLMASTAVFVVELYVYHRRTKKQLAHFE